LDRDPADIRHSTHVPVMEDSSVDRIAADMGAVIDAGLDQPIAYIQPPFARSQMERSAEAVAQLDVDHR
ncbi:MAG: LLM class F420-dependent oxidoreductase, partial [Actinomycetota bacterium]